MQKHEIAIVGAGPCGSLLAFLLADAGRDVVLLEKARHPRNKPCGGGITPKTRAFIPVAWDNSVEDECRRASLCYHRTVELEWAEPVCYMVQRSRFDEFLCATARGAGAALWEDTSVRSVEKERNHVTLHTERGPVLANLVVGADGAHSRVGAGMRRVRRYAFAAVTEVCPEPSRMEASRGKISVDFSVIPGGYGWIFPKGDHLNVGVYTVYPQAASIAAHLDRYLEKQGFGEALKTNRRGFPIPLRTESDQTVARDRVLLVGDAAALADPLTGEGVHAGCWSALLAAEAILKNSGNYGAAVSGYERLMGQKIWPQLRESDRLASVFYRYLHHAMSYLEKRPELAREFWHAVFLGQQEKLRLLPILGRILAGLVRREV